MKYAIEVKIRELFKVSSDLDTIKAIFIGDPNFILLEHYPAIILFIQRQIPFQEETGIWVYRYQGVISCETFGQDDYAVKDREADVESFLTLRTYLDFMSSIIEENLSLGSLIDNVGEKVRAIETGEKTYGLLERGNNITNTGSFAVEIETQKYR